jgi:uncharacterized protein (TIGR00730 family)
MRPSLQARSSPSSFDAVCVYAGAAAGQRPEYVEAARDLAAELARRGARLIYGGGSVGLMGELADASLALGNGVVGVIPRFLDEREIGHRGVELRVVETMHERKMLMADLADAFVVLPGGIGTLEEVVEMLSWSQLGLHRKPIGLLDIGCYWHPLVALLDHATSEGFISSDHRRLLLAAEGAGDLLDALAAWEPPHVDRWLQSADEA